MQIHVQQFERSRRGRRGCIILTIVLVLVIAAVTILPIILFVPQVSQLVSSTTGLNPGAIGSEAILKSQFGMETLAPPGDASRFDAVAAYPQIRAFAGDEVELIEARLFGVRADGTLDLNATYTPRPSASFKFQRRLKEPPPNAPPVGAGGSASGTWSEPIDVEIFQPNQLRRISRTGSGTNISIQYMHLGMTKQAKEPVAKAEPTLPAPTCAPAQLWQRALARGAPAEAVATIEYTRDGYRFSIQGTAVNLRFGIDCQPRQ